MTETASCFLHGDFDAALRWCPTCNAPPDIFTALDTIGDYIDRTALNTRQDFIDQGAAKHRATVALAEVRRVIDLLANDTTAADLRQQIEFLKAER